MGNTLNLVSTMSDKKSGKDLSGWASVSCDLSSDLSFKDDPILLMLEVLDHTRQSGSLSLTMMDAHRRFSKVK